EDVVQPHVQPLGVLADDDEVDALVAPPGTIVLVGRTLAYSSNTWRRETLTERYPSPTGVVRGPLRHSLVRRIESSVALGSGEPACSTPAMPPSCSSQSNAAPNALKTSSVASMISGPMPSPRIRVAARRLTAAPASAP